MVVVITQHSTTVFSHRTRATKHLTDRDEEHAKRTAEASEHIGIGYYTIALRVAVLGENIDDVIGIK